jgi:hypothetical protein
MTNYRSRLEERLARWLELNGYEFEYETIHLPYTLSATYTPDFVLPYNTLTKTSKTTYAQWAEKNGFLWAASHDIPLDWFDDHPDRNCH